MQDSLMQKLEEYFYRYTRQYDANILALAQEKGLNISQETLKEILEEAKHRE